MDLDWGELELPDIDYVEPPDGNAMLDIVLLGMLLGLWPYEQPADYEESLAMQRDIKELWNAKIRREMAELWEEWYV